VLLTKENEMKELMRVSVVDKILLYAKCPYCKQPYTYEKEDGDLFSYSNHGGLLLYVDCTNCGNTFQLTTDIFINQEIE
jgi:hypothetical protein